MGSLRAERIIRSTRPSRAAFVSMLRTEDDEDDG